MSVDFEQQLASRLRGLRQQHELSIRGLARLAGLPPELVSRSERGETVISLPSLVKICGALRLTLPEFFAFDAPAPKAEGVDEDLRAVLERLQRLPPKRRKQVARGLKLLLDDGVVAEDEVSSLAEETSAS
jgi:transcriptional regulator with XRE-family HTH domain